jgi:predicted MFS family arabinose efflux permease
MQENSSPSSESKLAVGPWEIRRLGLLFAALYFIQGIAEPGEGLIAQPLRSLMRSWGESAASIATISLIITVPWILKPFYGLLTDFVPIFGSRRKSYLFICSCATVLSLIFLFFFPPEQGAFGIFVVLLLVASVGVAFTDIVVDALMVEKGQPTGMTGRFQSIQWAAIYVATILTGSLGGFLSAHSLQKYSFLICGLVTLPTVLMAWFFIDESNSPKPPGSLRGDLKLLWQTAKSPAILAVCGFLFLLNFNPFSSTVLYLRMTNDLGWSEQFNGNCTSLASIGSVLGSIAYGFYCRRIRFSLLIHLGIAACVLSALGYWAMVDRTSAMVISVLTGFSMITTTLIQLDLAARVCPPAAAGTTFALLMAVSNLGLSASTWVGGHLYDYLKTVMEATPTFNTLVMIGAGCTAAGWLLVPWLQAPPGTRDPGIANPAP